MDIERVGIRAEGVQRSNARSKTNQRVAQLVEPLGRKPDQRFLVVCAGNAFVESAAQLPLDLGVPADRIRTERYSGSSLKDCA